MKNYKRTLLVVSILTLTILSVALLIYFRYLNPKIDTTVKDDTQTTITKEEEGFILEAKYIGESTWEYTVTGTLPNPCHEYTVNTIVMESYPEQVNISIGIENTGGVCIQVIQEIEESGTFNASSEAQVNLVVTRTPTL